MHQRNNNNNPNVTSPYSSTTTTNPDSISSTETMGARLIVFSSKYSNTTNTVQHHYVPYPPIESDFVFESTLIVFKIVSLFLQYILLYKSEKWAGPSNISADSFIHWRHIDRYVIGILIIFCVSLQDKLYHLRVLINTIALTYSFWIYSWKYVLVFTYPLICSLLIDQNSKSDQQQTMINTSNSLPEHRCSLNACDLRLETDCLRFEFNHRIRHILFSSFLSFYYICIVPLAFCDTYYIRLDVILLLQYGVILFLSLMMIYSSHYLPLHLLTVFHRNGKHLGSWQCLINHAYLPMIAFWDEKSSQSYELNSIVKYKRNVYRSSSCSTTVCEPGNSGHTRFAMLFNRPFIFPLILCSLQILLLMMQLLLLFYDQRWFVLLSQMILFIFNTYTIHHTTRDMYLLYLVYSGE